MPGTRPTPRRLLAQGKAYRCFCTREELDAQRATAEKTSMGFRYDGRCGRLRPAEIAERLEKKLPFSIRLRMPDEEIAWDDAVHDRISFQGRDLDDFIILRSDGTPIYNLAVVSDDVEMRITHVIRGDDHISNTPKQIALYRAMGHEPPIFAHVPMILGPDGKKLSKRHGATAVGDYQSQGILPAAMRNFLALLGWSPGGDREIMPEAQMIELFSLEGIQKKPAVFDVNKLLWMNGEYLSALPATELEGPTLKRLQEMGVAIKGRDIKALIDAVKSRSRTILDIANQVRTRIDTAPPELNPKAEAFRQKMGRHFELNLRATYDALSEVQASEWSSTSTLSAISKVAFEKTAKLGDVMQPVRIAITGSTVSEPVNELLGVVGKETALKKISHFLSEPPSSSGAQQP